MLKQFIKDYFTFSYAERRGIIILLLVIFLTLTFRLILPALIKQSDGETEAFNIEVNQRLNNIAENEMIPVNSDNRKNTGNMHYSLFDFDPNVISSDEIKNLDVNNSVRKAWINYRAKGGKFYSKEDLKKIYGLDSFTYHRLEPYIILGNENNRSIFGTVHGNKNILTIELNKATQEEFENLKGIGPVLAQRICKYRNLLGGFSSIRQLNEVFGIIDSIVKVNESILSIDKSLIEKININRTDFRTLSRHPYISDYEAKAIIHYREMKGFVASFNELVINNLISDSVLTKLTDYLIIKE